MTEQKCKGCHDGRDTSGNCPVCGVYVPSPDAVEEGRKQLHADHDAAKLLEGRRPKPNELHVEPISFGIRRRGRSVDE